MAARISALAARLAGLASLALASLALTGGPVLAQAPAVRPARTFVLPAAPLADSLRALSQQSGLAILIDADLARNRRAPAVRVTGTPMRALDQLLAGSGLAARLAGGVVVVEARARAAAPPLPLADAAETVSQLDDVWVVAGRPGALRRSLAAKRAADGVSDVISADDLGELPSNNVAESVARLPGVSAVRNHQTGEGDRITVRGMSTEWNAYRMNGVRLGGVGSRADNFFRGVRLSYLPPEGVQSISVAKTLTPDMDGDGLGGLIDIRTPSAFDAEDGYVRLSVEGGQLTRFDRPASRKLALAVSHRFSDSLGLYLSANWSDQASRFEMVGGDSDDRPPNWYASVNSVGWDVSTFIKQGMELGTGETRVRRQGLNGGLDWRSGPDALHLRVQYNHYDGEEYRNRLNFRNDTLRNSLRLTQVDPDRRDLAQPDAMVTGADPTLGRIYGYALADIEDVDEDGLITDADRTVRSLYTLNGGSGVWDPQGFRLRRYWEGIQESGLLASLVAGGRHERSAWTVDYDLSLARLRDRLDNGYSLALRTDAYGWLGNTGLVVVETDDPRFPLWSLNPAGMEGVQDPAANEFRSFTSSRETVEETLWQAQANAAYRPAGSIVDAIQFGGRYTHSQRERTQFDVLDLAGPETLADLEPLFGAPALSLFDGRYSGLHRLGVTLDADKVLAEAARGQRGESAIFTQSAIAPGQAIAQPLRSFRLTEQVLALYAMATARVDDWTVIGGVRVEGTRNAITLFVSDPVQGDRFERDYTHFINVLPSVHLRRDLGDAMVLRAAVWTSFARPDIARMITAREYVYDRDPDDDGVNNPMADWVLTEITQGNPDLKPMEAVAYDLSIERYDRLGAYSLAVFHKDIRNFLYRSSTSSIRDGALQTVGEVDGVPLIQPGNGASAEVTGIELGLRRLLSDAPGPLGGLGLNANLTWQWSSAKSGIAWRGEDDGLRLMETPEFLAAVELFWRGGPWEAMVAWSRQSAFLEGLDSYANDPYEQGYSFVDLQVRRRVGGGGTAALQVRNLLNSHTYWYTFGSSANGSVREYIRNGPVVSLSFSQTF